MANCTVLVERCQHIVLSSAPLWAVSLPVLGAIAACLGFSIALRYSITPFPAVSPARPTDSAPEGPPPMDPTKPEIIPSDSEGPRLGGEADERREKAEQINQGKNRWKEVDEWWSKDKSSWEVRTRQPSPENQKYLFISRTRHPAHSRTAPFTILSIQSTRLASVIRRVLLNNASAFDDYPEVAATNCFLERGKLQAVRDAAINDATRQKNSTVSDGSALPNGDGNEACTTEESVQGLNREAKSIEEIEAEADELAVLLDWIDRHYERTRSTLARMLPAKRISFKLLWYIFHPDARAVMSHIGTSEKAGFRISSSNYIETEDGPVFVIAGKRLIWNGAHWKKERLVIKIEEFSDTVDIEELACQPLTEAMEATLVKRGRLARQYAGIHHLNYEGVMTQIFDTPRGREIVKLRAKGRVMVDVKSFRRVNPGRDTIGEAEASGRSPILRRPSPQDGAHQDGRAAEEARLPVDSARDEDLWLLSPTLHGFSFALKEWGEMLVDQFTDIQFDDSAFDHLVMDPRQKQLIMGLVEATRTSTRKELMQDVITNKGQGAVVCLHGSAGSGKSLTAESCAEKLRRPLYLIGASELGTSAESVEKNLRDALELANCWDAVMLIDEADVYLEARGPHELHRNALVSVFLRLLDYSSSILFLTTNRVQNFDPAFVSRFSVAIKYPDLDRESRLAVWKRFLERADMLVTPPKALTGGIVPQVDQPHSDTKTNGQQVSPISHQQLTNLAERPMNGRSIRNTIRTAQSIALSNGVPVSFEHIMAVIAVSESFAKDMKDPDQGMYSAKGEHWADTSTLYQ